MKGPSERLFQEALKKVDIFPLYAFKPQDAMEGQRKPCDFLVWHGMGAAYAASVWCEVKETPNVGTWDAKELTPSQRQGIRTAADLGIPYIVAIRWKRNGMWSIVDAIRLMDWLETAEGITAGTSVKRVTLESRFGVSSSPEQLPNILKAAFIEGL